MLYKGTKIGEDCYDLSPEQSHEIFTWLFYNLFETRTTEDQDQYQYQNGVSGVVRFSSGIASQKEVTHVL
jgi:hypothetical protein